jgi:hypothetical protein
MVSRSGGSARITRIAAIGTIAGRLRLLGALTQCVARVLVSRLHGSVYSRARIALRVLRFRHTSLVRRVNGCATATGSVVAGGGKQGSDKNCCAEDVCILH